MVGSGALIRSFSRAALVPLLTSFLSCHASAPSRAPAAVEPAAPARAFFARGEAPVDAVVLVVVDGARWQEIFEGVDPKLGAAAGVPFEDAKTLLPNLHRYFGQEGILVGDAHRGDRILASGPNYVSLPGYSEILRGLPSSSCFDNDCPQTVTPTLLDELADEPGARREQVALISSWERIPLVAAARPERMMVSAGRDPVADRGLGPWPGGGGYRPDAVTAPVAMRYLETERPRFLFIGLGDTDEFAHHGDYRGYVSALRFADAVLGRLAAVLDRFAAEGRRTALFATADHGRAANFRDHGGFAPESANVWLGVRSPSIPLNQALTGARLADIAPAIRRMLHTGR
jgi:hypothetical protein